jgi:hypothetical protein
MTPNKALNADPLGGTLRLDASPRCSAQADKRIAATIRSMRVRELKWSIEFCRAQRERAKSGRLACWQDRIAELEELLPIRLAPPSVGETGEAGTESGTSGTRGASIGSKIGGSLGGSS